MSEVTLVSFCSRSKNITPLFKVHATYDIPSIHPRKLKLAVGSWINHVDLCHWEEGIKMKNNALFMLKKKNNGYKKNSVNLSNNRHTKKQKQNIKFWYSAELINCYRLLPRIITWCLRPIKSHKDTQVPFIPRESPVASILNESLEHFRNAPIWTLHSFANNLNSFLQRSSIKITFLYLNCVRPNFGLHSKFIPSKYCKLTPFLFLFSHKLILFV